MGHRPLLAIALGWVIVVSAVAAVTFVVVDRAGRGVGQASAAGTVAAMPTVPASTDHGGTSSVRPSSSPTPTRTAAQTGPTRPGAPAPTSTTRPPAPTPTVGPAEPRTASFTTEGGTVVASCAATKVTLDSITPRDGWRFEKESEGGDLEVHFKPRAEDVDEVEIKIGCVRGTPTRREG